MVAKSLNRKLIRDIQALKWQVLSIALVVGAGIAVFIGGMTTYDTLKAAKQQHYQTQRFADIFAYLKRAPNSLLPRIEKIPGVMTAEKRLVYDATIEMPDMKSPAIGRFISLPEHHLPGINRLYLRQGSFIDPNSKEPSVLVNEAFAKAHHLLPGYRFVAILNGNREALTVAGIVLSPEFVYAVRSQDVVPDDKHFGIFWISYPLLSATFKMTGAFNSLVLKTARGIQKRSVIKKLDALLLPYGGEGAIENSAQLSNRIITNELRQLAFLAGVIPSVFLLVAAFLLNIVCARLVNIQREQIATLKAIGYSDRSIGWYYIKLIGLIVLIGTLIGIIFGAWMGNAMINLYRYYFHFPIFKYTITTLAPMIAIGVSLFAALLGTLSAVRWVIQLPPAEAMRPQPPSYYSKTLVDRLYLMKVLPASIKMIARYIIRRPLHSLFTVVGVAFSVSILIMGLFWRDSTLEVINTQFRVAQREHAIVTFTDPVKQSALTEISKLKSVLAVEGVRAVPARLTHLHYHYDTGVIALKPTAKQILLLDRDGHSLKTNPHALLLSAELAKRLHVKIGNKVHVQVLQGKRPQLVMPVKGIINDYVGLSAYTTQKTLNRAMGDGDVISSANLLVENAHLDQLIKQLKGMPKVATIQLKSTIIDLFNETFVKHLTTFLTFFIGFATVIAVGVIYNAARIALAEREWEMASLRVLGFTNAEVSFFVIGELAFEMLLGIPLGFLFGYVLSILSSYLMPSEFFRIPVFITSESYALAALVTLVSGVICAVLVTRRMKHFHLIDVLKRID